MHSEGPGWQPEKRFQRIRIDFDVPDFSFRVVDRLPSTLADKPTSKIREKTTTRDMDTITDSTLATLALDKSEYY